MNSLRKENRLYAKQAMNAAVSLLQKVDGDPHVEPKDTLSRRRAVEAVLNDIDNYDGTGSILPPKAKHPLIIGAFAVAAAALIVLMVGFQFSSKTNKREDFPIAKRPTENHIQALLASGEENDRNVVGQKLKQESMINVGDGDVSFELRDRGVVWLSARTHFRLLKNEDSAFEIFLERGDLVALISPQGESSKIVVDTPSGRVIVTGTRFSVRVSEQGAFVSVSKGSVAVESKSSGRFPVGKSETACLDTGEISKIDKNEKDKIDEIARSFGQPDDSNEAVAEIHSAAPGQSAITDNKKEPAAIKQQAKKRVDPYFIPAREMLENAQSFRKDRNWQGAAEAYQQLIDKFPASAEARTARVPLGMIELNHLGNPGQALESFEIYLDTPIDGALAQEAAYGRIKALRALGRTAEEMRIIEAFLVEYPLSLRIPELRRRLEALKGEDSKKVVSVSKSSETLEE